MFREMAFSAESGQLLLNADESHWRSVLQQCAEQLESSAALLLEGYVMEGHAPTAASTGRSEPALAGLLQNIERVAGLCRLFDARRATVFCADLAALFTQLVGTPGPLAADTLALASVSLLQVTRFLTEMRAPISDTQFDVETLNALRLAIGKRPLPPHSGGRTGVQGGVQDGPWNACDTATVRALLMQRIRGAQAMLGPPMEAKVEAADPSSALPRELAPELVRELHAISSVLQVLGLQRLGVMGLADKLDPESAAGFLLKLELRLCGETRALRRTSGLVRAGDLAAVDCLLRDARRQWRATAYRRLHIMVTSLDQAPFDQAPLDQARLESGAIPEPAGLELVALWDSLRLTDELHPGLVPHAEWSLLLAAGARLFRHLLCWQSVALGMDGSISPTLATRGRQLVLRLQLNALDCLSADAANSGDLPPLPGWRRQQVQTLLRDCQHFERLQRTVWRRRLAAECTPDAVLLRTFREELRETLVLLERGSGWPQSDAFCTVVARLSQNALVVGEVLLHEVLDALRQLLTALLERQESIGAEELALLELLREHLRRRLQEPPSPEDDALVTLQSCIGRRMARLHAPQAEMTDVFVEGGRTPQTRIAITQLPVYLAQNIRELLSAAERLETCLAAGTKGRADFVALNRVLIVELRMLATGARALQVYRVARLSAVLAELHQALAVPSIITTSSACSLEPDLLAQLVEAHCLLRRGLNQAAARREVDNPRDVIAGLYRRLDQLQTTLVAPLPDRPTEWQPLEDPACYHEFRREAEALVHRMECDVDAMATGAGTEAGIYHDMLHALHTLKGNARLFACERLASDCHRCESALLGAKDAALVQAGAVAERDVAYGSVLSRAGALSPLGTLPHVELLVSELRAALDELPLAASVPLPPEHGITIPAASLQRIAALAGSARTQVRAALDVLQSCRREPDAARLSLLADLLTEQERCVVQLDEEVAGSRLVSFSRVTPRLQRLVGQHSNQLDRQLRLRVRNDGLRVDRLLLERLIAPLEHLLRNAIDHGIEPVAVRRACGKADGGTVLLELQECDDQLVLELRDDGAGISHDALLACAARLGMTESEEAPERRLQWVLRPGFSTRVQATQDSGHGIGLAMVNSVVTALGGRVEVESTPGIGSCFRLLLPRWDIASKPV